jgi:predicted RecB family endonuclease
MADGGLPLLPFSLKNGAKTDANYFNIPEGGGGISTADKKLLKKRIDQLEVNAEATTKQTLSRIEGVSVTVNALETALTAFTPSIKTLKIDMATVREEFDQQQLRVVEAFNTQKATYDKALEEQKAAYDKALEEQKAESDRSLAALTAKVDALTPATTNGA